VEKHKTSCWSSAIIAGMLCCAASVQAADDSGWYVGAGVGSSRASDAGSIGSALDANLATQGIASGTTLDSTDTAWKVFGGYQFNKYFGVEGGYNRLGRFSANSVVAGGSGSGTWEANRTWTLAGTGTLPITDQLSLTGKAGAAYSKAELDYSATGAGGTFGISQSASHTEPVVGLGLKYDLDRHLALRGEWEHFKDVGDTATTGQSDINVWSASLQYRF
jgi:OOP family OmpA-OmpF porin